MHENLEACERQGFRRVAHEPGRRVPAAGDEQTTAPVQWVSRECAAAEPKDTHYPYTP